MEFIQALEIVVMKALRSDYATARNASWNEAELFLNLSVSRKGGD
jgi:hypothetical protein